MTVVLLSAFFLLLVALGAHLLLTTFGADRSAPLALPSATPAEHLPLAAESDDVSGMTDWPREARIGTPYDYPEDEWEDWERAVERSVADGVNVLLDWSCISDTYQGRVLDPDSCLPEVERRAQHIHTRYADVRYVLYIAPLEMATTDSDLNRDGVDDDGRDSTFTDHPDWLQVGIDGRPAVFYGSMPAMPFWVDPTSEDVWLSPNVPEYRGLIMDLARDIAATGVDGVWFDVPFLVHDFGDGWQAQWSDHNPAAEAQFLADTGYHIPTSVAWDDPAWQEWIGWRYAQTASFIEDFGEALKAADPHVRLIIETSTGAGVNSTTHASHVLDLTSVSDVTIHEFSDPYDVPKYHFWPHMLSTLAFYRGVDGDRPSWILSYVQEGQADLAQLHSATVLTAGLNYYTSGSEGMSGLPDEAFRRQLFHWLEEYEAIYYDPSVEPYANVALLYSRQTLDYVDRGDWDTSEAFDDYQGLAMMLLESHVPYLLETDQDLTKLSRFDALVLPSFTAMSSSQARIVSDYVKDGGTIIATGDTSLRDELGILQADYQLADVFGVHAGQVDTDEIYVHEYGQGCSVFAPFMFGAEYYWAAAPTWDGGEPGAAEEIRARFLEELWSAAGVTPILETDAPPGVLFLVFKKHDQVQLRAINYQGVSQGNATPTPADHMTVQLVLPPDMEATSALALDFLGDWQRLLFTRLGPGHVATVFDLDTHAVVAFER